MATRKPAKDRPGTPIDNRNFLAPTGFKFSLKRSPGVAFFCNQANIPSLDLGIATQPSYLKDIDVPGDKIQFGDLTLRFLVDEDLVNYMEIQNWIRGLGYPETLQEFDRLDKEAVLPSNFGRTGDNIYSDGTLQILSSNLVAKFNVNFKDMFPYSLSTITFDATDTDIEYFTADVSFKYTIYNLTDLSNKPL
ncbi:head-proximal tip of tail tube tail completion + sheath stabilizer protein [Synechococcus phage S-SM2]|uniref:Head-proximal tip of tail tube tail completion + sheath stabilizer protein n=1 Tax=Synechococcus phage S-SM2 TaxID=444860 RepID=E3SJ15_9CAUD|nr:head-proximal tip of tail tube tail completion + sheath stabilizer protein [Synechococcus phage S-SM2]ADO97463.1 head-proximal tip of tail tube tail completion + sheath stabilizer protein [Synechococcus phage S-SM2]